LKLKFDKEIFSPKASGKLPPWTQRISEILRRRNTVSQSFVRRPMRKNGPGRSPNRHRSLFFL